MKFIEKAGHKARRKSNADNWSSKRSWEVYCKTLCSTWCKDCGSKGYLVLSKVLQQECSVDSKKMWCLAGPTIFMPICQYTVGASTQLFGGNLGTIELDAFSVENYV